MYAYSSLMRCFCCACAQTTGIRTYGFAYSGRCYIYNSYLCHWKARNFVGLYQEDGLLRLCLVQLLETASAAKKQKANQTSKTRSCFRVVQFLQHLEPCFLLSTFSFSKWVEIDKCYNCFKGDKEMGVGFIVILTKQPTTFFTAHNSQQLFQSSQPTTVFSKFTAKALNQTDPIVVLILQVA